jgi:hypothetical protein
MKATRRQELRTNRLSQQIEQVGEYAKQHTVSLVAAVVVAVVVIGAVYWYYTQRQRDVMDAWYTISGVAAVDAETPIETIESVARQDLQPALTAEALLVIGDRATAKLAPTNAAEGFEVGDAADGETDWSAKACQAYQEIADRFPEPAHTTASGKAMIMLGVLAEDADDVAKARQWYERIIGDERFAGTPFLDNATYRLKNQDRWRAPVVFPPPSPSIPLPPPTPTAGMSTSARRPPAVSSPKSVQPGAVGKAATPSGAAGTPAAGGGQSSASGDSGAVAPATQPSGGAGASP